MCFMYVGDCMLSIAKYFNATSRIILVERKKSDNFRMDHDIMRWLCVFSLIHRLYEYDRNAFCVLCGKG